MIQLFLKSKQFYFNCQIKIKNYEKSFILFYLAKIYLRQCLIKFN